MQSHTLHAWLCTFPPCTQTVSALTFRRDLHAGLRTYVVFARIFPLLVARHHNVDNLGSLAWSSPRHLVAAASLLFLTLATCVYKTNSYDFLYQVQRKSVQHNFGNVLSLRLRCCALLLTVPQVRTVMTRHDAFLYILICDSLACFRLQLTMKFKNKVL